jgi:hypothetical protein
MSGATAARRASRAAARSAAPSSGNGIGKTGGKTKSKSRKEENKQQPQLVGLKQFHIPERFSQEEHDQIYFTAKKLAISQKIPLQEAIDKVVAKPRHYLDWAKRRALASKSGKVGEPVVEATKIPNRQKIRENLGRALAKRTGLPLNIAIRKIKNSQIEQETKRLTERAKRKTAKVSKKKPGKKKSKKSKKTQWVKIYQGGAPGLGGKS